MTELLLHKTKVPNHGAHSFFNKKEIVPKTKKNLNRHWWKRQNWIIGYHYWDIPQNAKRCQCERKDNTEIIPEDSISTQWKLYKDGMELVEMIIKYKDGMELVEMKIIIQRNFPKLDELKSFN